MNQIKMSQNIQYEQVRLQTADVEIPTNNQLPNLNKDISSSNIKLKNNKTITSKFYKCGSVNSKSTNNFNRIKEVSELQPQTQKSLKKFEFLLPVINVPNGKQDIQAETQKSIKNIKLPHKLSLQSTDMYLTHYGPKKLRPSRSTDQIVVLASNNATTQNQQIKDRIIEVAQTVQNDTSKTPARTRSINPMVQREITRISDYSNITGLEKASKIKKAMLKDVVNLNRMLHSRYESVPVQKTLNFSDKETSANALSSLQAQTVSSSFKKLIPKQQKNFLTVENTNTQSPKQLSEQEKSRKSTSPSPRGKHSASPSVRSPSVRDYSPDNADLRHQALMNQKDKLLANKLVNRFLCNDQTNFEEFLIGETKQFTHLKNKLKQEEEDRASQAILHSEKSSVDKDLTADAFKLIRLFKEHSSLSSKFPEQSLSISTHDKVFELDPKEESQSEQDPFNITIDLEDQSDTNSNASEPQTFDQIKKTQAEYRELSDGSLLQKVQKQLDVQETLNSFIKDNMQIKKQIREIDDSKKTLESPRAQILINQETTTDILLNETLSQVKTISGKHGQLLEQLLARKIKETQDKHAQMTKQIQQEKQNLFIALSQSNHCLENAFTRLTDCRTLSKQLNLAKEFVLCQQLEQSKLYSDKYQECEKAKNDYKDLSTRISAWFPNFEKYTNDDSYLQKIVFVKEDGTTDMELDPLEKRKQLAADDMTYYWGVSQEDLEDQVFQGKKLVETMSRNDLWLRSDLIRLDTLFQVPTLVKIDNEKIKERMTQVQDQFDNLEKVNQTLELRLQICQEQLDFTKETMEKQELVLKEKTHALQDLELRTIYLQREDQEIQTDSIRIMTDKEQKSLGRMGKKKKRVPSARGYLAPSPRAERNFNSDLLSNKSSKSKGTKYLNPRPSENNINLSSPKMRTVLQKSQENFDRSKPKENSKEKHVGNQKVAKYYTTLAALPLDNFATSNQKALSDSDQSSQEPEDQYAIMLEKILKIALKEHKTQSLSDVRIAQRSFNVVKNQPESTAEILGKLYRDFSWKSQLIAILSGINHIEKFSFEDQSSIGAGAFEQTFAYLKSMNQSTPTNTEDDYHPNKNTFMVDHTNNLLPNAVSFLVFKLQQTDPIETQILKQSFTIDIATNQIKETLQQCTKNYVSSEFIMLLVARARKQMLLSIDFDRSETFLESFPNFIFWKRILQQSDESLQLLDLLANSNHPQEGYHSLSNLQQQIQDYLLTQNSENPEQAQIDISLISQCLLDPITTESKSITFDQLKSLKERMDSLIIPIPVVLKSLVECLKLVQLKTRGNTKTFVQKFMKPGKFVIEKRNLANAFSTFAKKKSAKQINDFLQLFYADKNDKPITLGLFEQMCHHLDLFKHSVQDSNGQLLLNLPLQIIERKLFVDMPPGSHFENCIPESNPVSFIGQKEGGQLMTKVYERDDQLSHLKVHRQDNFSDDSSSIREEVDVPKIFIDDNIAEVEVVHESAHYSDFSGVRHSQNLTAEHFMSDDDAKQGKYSLLPITINEGKFKVPKQVVKKKPTKVIPFNMNQRTSSYSPPKVTEQVQIMIDKHQTRMTRVKQTIPMQEIEIQERPDKEQEHQTYSSPRSLSAQRMNNKQLLGLTEQYLQSPELEQIHSARSFSPNRIADRHGKLKWLQNEKFSLLSKQAQDKIRLMYTRKVSHENLKNNPQALIQKGKLSIKLTHPAKRRTRSTSPLSACNSI